MSNANAIATTVAIATTTIKVVINGCYGGFGLSEEATKWLAERGDKKAAAHLADEDNYWGDKEFDQYRPRCHRHDRRLVACVEALGAQTASGMYAELQIVKIKGNQYYINNEDGVEQIITPATVPWVQV